MKKEKIRDVYFPRILKRVTQDELAVRIGKSQSWVARVESGEITLSPTERVRIMRALVGSKEEECHD